MPTPLGPKALCELAARKSTSSFFTSMARCEIDCAASSKTGMPRACAIETTSATGAMQPVTLETCANATSFVRGVRSNGSVSQRGTPSSSMGMSTGRAPTRHGSQLAWCSLAGKTTSSSCPRQRPWASRLMASVVPRTKTISSGEAPTRLAASRRAPS